MAMDFEEILGKCGDGHRYQYMLLALYGLLMFIVSRFLLTNYIFDKLG